MLSFEKVSTLHETILITLSLVTLPPNMPQPDNLPRSFIVLYCLIQKIKRQPPLKKKKNPSIYKTIKSSNKDHFGGKSVCT